MLLDKYLERIILKIKSQTAGINKTCRDGYLRLCRIFFRPRRTGMAVTRQKKGEILKDLKERLKKARIIVFVNFHGLNVKTANELRKILRGIGVNYLVTKKTLIRKTFEVLPFEGNIPELEGEIALVFSEEDPIVSVKTLEKFAKNNKTIKLIGGVFENRYIGGETVIMLANIPPREVLLGQFINIINSPRRGLVVTLNGVAKKLVNVLCQKNLKTSLKK